MTAQSFTYCGNIYTGASAGTVDFPLTSTAGNPILYLETAHIHVYKSANQGGSWTELTRPSQWDFVSSGTVARLVTGIATGDWVKVQRITPSSSSYVTFQASSLLTAEQLNDDTLFNTYLNQELFDQGAQSSLIATTSQTAANAATAASTAATSASNAATSTANTALSTANAAVSTANAASAASAAATATANQAATNAAAAVSTANTASSNASTALSTANTASTNASNAVTTANTASGSASTAITTANTAASNASTALSTANAAASNASTALSTANAASTNASAAVTTANSASSTASAASATATSANSKADQAIAAVGSSVLYELVANVAAIPGSPANNKAIEVYDSTGIESFTPLANRPAGFVGSSGLSVRIIYSTSGSTWNWIQYFPNDPEARYLKFSGGTLTGQLRGDDSTSASTPGFAFDGDPDTGIGRSGANELALITGGVARLTFDSAGNGTFTNSVTIPAGSTVTGYLTTASAASTYQTQAGMSSYIPTSAIGVTVQGYDVTTLKSSAIGVTVQGYDATTLKSSAIGVTVQPFGGPPGDNTVSTIKLQDDAVTEAKLATGSVTSTKLAANAVATSNIADGAVTAAKIAAGAAGFPAGTAMLFAQTAAPTGWTKSTTHDNKALRVVSGTAGSGGTTAFTSVFTSRTPTGTVGSTTLAESQMPSHTHQLGYAGGSGTTGPNNTLGAATPPYGGLLFGVTTYPTGGGGAHNHSFTGTALDFNVQYVDVIIAVKD